MWGDITGCVQPSQIKTNLEPIQRCCKVIYSLLSAYKLIFSLQGWVHIWNGDGFPSKNAQSPYKLTCVKALRNFRVNFTVWWRTMFMYFLSNFSSLLCIVESLEWHIPAHLHQATPEFICLHCITWPTSPFPLWEPCSDCLEGSSTSKVSSLTLLFFLAMDIGCVKCGPWCLGVANSTEMPSVWFAALLPIMLNHCLSSWALCIIKLMFAKKYPSDTSLAVGLEATTILTSFLKAKWGKLKIQSRNQSHFPEFASTEFF